MVGSLQSVVAPSQGAEYFIQLLHHFHWASHLDFARLPSKQAGTRRTRVALMDRLYARATTDQCTQTPFPGSDLLDPNPFVPSPIKRKDTPGVGDKRALPSVSVSNP